MVETLGVVEVVRVSVKVFEGEVLGVDVTAGEWVVDPEEAMDLVLELREV